jgi:hypothetical protein
MKPDAMNEPTVFVVRVWRDATQFRATARPVERDETMVFSEREELLRYLAPGQQTSKVEDGLLRPLTAESAANSGNEV